MSLRDVIARDQVKLFGNPKEFGEAVSYTDSLGVTAAVMAFVEREDLEAKKAAGYGANVGRQCIYVWFPLGSVPKVVVGVDRVKLRLVREDQAETELLVVAIMPESDACWRLECER